MLACGMARKVPEGLRTSKPLNIVIIQQEAVTLQCRRILSKIIEVFMETLVLVLHGGNAEVDYSHNLRWYPGQRYNIIHCLEEAHIPVFLLINIVAIVADHRFGEGVEQERNGSIM
jgi:hypothetical protein